MFKKIISVLSVIVLSSFPVLFMYFQNVAEAGFSEIILPLGVYVGIGLIIFFISSLFTKSLCFGAVISIPFILVFENYAFLEKAIKGAFSSLRYWHIVPIFIFILIHLGYLIYKKCPKEMMQIITQVVCGVFAALIALNAAMAIPSFIIVAESKLNHSAQVTREEITVANDVDTENLPNVYWLLFDEYSSFDVIQKYYNYDNSEFAKWLEDRNFTVSYDSVNESQQTNTITANISMLEYAATDDMTREQRNKIRRNGKLLPLVEQYGYFINGLGNSETFMETQSKQNATSMGGRSFSDILIERTPFYIFQQESGNERIEKIKQLIRKFQKNEIIKSDQPNFVLYYELLPHQPFVFNSDGSENSLQNWHDWVNKENYLNQYIYTTTYLKDIIGNIIENDPNAIIVLQSDHSARSLQTPSGEYLIDKYDRRNTLNAVYFSGEKIAEIEGESSVNTWRLIFNRLFNLNYPILEVPCSEYEF